MTRVATSGIDVVASRAQDGEFCTRVIEESGQAVYACYQCQRCGGGCPVASAAGTTPSRFLRLLALGLADEALKDPLLWLCVGCSMCGARCPNEISTNEVIDRFRALTSDKRDIDREAKDIRIFHRLFLKQIRYMGRSHELLLIGAMKMATRKFLKDIGLGITMFRKGKIPLVPHLPGGIPEVRAIFRKRAGKR